jgi:hypothetical protein
MELKLHTPERHPDETQDQYRSRQRSSKWALHAMTKPPRQSPALNKFDVSRFFLGHHMNKAANARRAVKAVIGARQYRKQRKALALATREAA